MKEGGHRFLWTRKSVSSSGHQSDDDRDDTASNAFPATPQLGVETSLMLDSTLRATYNPRSH